MARKKINEMPSWPDARGWIGIGTYALTIMVLWMMQIDPTLRRDEFFKVIATAIVLTGFIQGVVGWAYTATKGGGELADANAKIVADAAGKGNAAADPGKPQPVTIMDQKKPVEVTEKKPEDEEDVAPKPRS